MTAIDELKRLSGTYFDGAQFVKSAAASGFDVIDPATEDTIGQIPDTTEAEVDAVIARANKVQREWNAQNSLTRAEVLHEVAARMREMTPVLAEMMTREMGKPYKETADEVAWSASAIDYYAEVARHDAGKVIGSAVDGQFHYTVKEPLGTVVAILPFNFPLVLFCWEAAAALAAGNSIILKPSELTTLTSLKFMECFEPLPAGLVQCVPGGGRVGQQLVASPNTHMVAFTGGVETGQIVAKACAEQFKHCLIEASGNDPFIVMPSAPLDMAARGATFAAYLNCGQVCTAGERFFVHESIHDAFVDAVVQQAGALRIGNGLDKVDIGPMVTEKERTRFEAVMARAQEQGAKVACGGKRPAGFNKGWYYEPTVLTDVTPDMDIMNAESFGPSMPICKVSSFDEAIELANRSKYGLGANVYTTNLGEANRAVNELEAGMVWVNAPLLDNDAGPFGGRKMSGIGRQLGAEGLDSFRHTKLAMIDPQCAAQDFWWFPYKDTEACPEN
ncbi:MAG: aldehyde dehydrogenase family protein [Alphaproteobacteria bacterium]|nr:aldehyde dehydrogenase family protein [Alphaproteobacteria bacterium]